MYISHFGEYVILENVSPPILQKLRNAPDVQVHEDSQLQPFDTTTA
jgi:hypothetical protein